MPVNEWSNVHAQGYLDLGLLIPELVQRVDVTKGPFTLTQGAFAMAGSANYRLGAPPTERGWRAAYTLGTTNRHRLFASYSPADGDGRSYVGFELTHDDGFGEGRALDRGTFNARATLFERGLHRLAVFALAGAGRFALPGTVRNDDVAAGRVDFYGRYDERTHGLSARALAGAVYDWSAGGHALTLTLYGGYRRLSLLENYTGYLYDAENGDRRDQRQETTSFGLDLAHQVALLPRFTLRLGGGLRGDAFDQRVQHVGQELELLSTQRDLVGTQLLAHVRAGLRWTPIDALRIDAGARVDLVHASFEDRREQETGNDQLAAVSPRLSLRWDASDALGLFAAYGRGFRPPEARAFTSEEVADTGVGEELYTGGDPAITTSDAIEL